MPRNSPIGVSPLKSSSKCIVFRFFTVIQRKIVRAFSMSDVHRPTNCRTKSVNVFWSSCATYKSRSSKRQFVSSFKFAYTKSEMKMLNSCLHLDDQMAIHSLYGECSSIKLKTKTIHVNGHIWSLKRDDCLYQS